MFTETVASLIETLPARFVEDITSLAEQHPIVAGLILGLIVMQAVIETLHFIDRRTHAHAAPLSRRAKTLPRYTVGEAKHVGRSGGYFAAGSVRATPANAMDASR